MKGLYQGKYLIAIYDKDDNLIDVCDTPAEMEEFGLGSRAQLSRYLHNDRSFKNSRNRYHLIDITEEHDDIFVEEDEIFKKYADEHILRPSDKELAAQLGMSLRTYYRHKYTSEMYDKLFRKEFSYNGRNKTDKKRRTSASKSSITEELRSEQQPEL